MADMVLSGRVVGVGVPTLDLYYRLSFARFQQSGTIQTQADDTFSLTVALPDDPSRFLRFPINFNLLLRAFLPADNRRDAEVDLSLQGVRDAQEFFDRVLQATQDLSALRIASAPARRQENAFQGRLFCRPADLDSGAVWVLMHNAPAVPVSPSLLIRPSVGRVFVRTRALADRAAVEEAGDVILLEQVDQRTGVGTLSEDLSPRINPANLGIRDPDLDFVGGNMRIRGRVVVRSTPVEILGQPVSGIDLFGIGRFEVVLALSIPDRALLPCRESEFDNPLTVSIVSSAFDIFPDTDLDEYDLTITAIESFIAGPVAERLRDEIKAKIRERLEDTLDEKFAEIHDRLEEVGFSDADQVAAELRATLYMHLDRVSIDANNLRLRAFVGTWHDVNAWSTLECGATAASAMFYASRPLPVFRRYEKALSRMALFRWMELYRKHAKEIAQLVRRDPSLAGQIVRLAFDLQPVLNEKAGIPLSTNAVERLTELAEIARAKASPELAGAIDRGMEVLKSGEGHDLHRLVVLASEALPAKAGRAEMKQP